MSCVLDLEAVHSDWTTRIPLSRLLVGLFLLCGSLLSLTGCKENQEAADAPIIALPDGSRAVLQGDADAPSRAALVAAADRLALNAEKAPDSEAADMLARAAELRESSYLVEGREVDALEALELWSDAEERSDGDACSMGLRMAHLKAHLSSDPARQYRDLYILRERQPDASCRERIDRALAVLSTYRPTEQELAEMREEVEARASAEESEDSHSEPHVVVPDLKAGLERPTSITKIEPFGAERTARVVVHVTHPTRFNVGTLKASTGRGPRLFVDIQHASYEGPPSYEMDGLVQRVRVGQHDDSTRVVMDLSQTVHPRVFYLPEPFRLVVDLSVQPPEQLARPRDIRRVVLDPGHGGSDPGALGPNGLREKDVTLDIAHRAAPLLAREVGVSTLLTRDVDVYVPLDERAAKANAFHADLFVSLHLNSSENGRSRGVMTFVLDSSRDEAAAKVAARENASSEAAAAELANALSRIGSADRRAASEMFAKLLQRAAGASLRQHYDEVEDHGVRRAGFYVLAGASMPAVLFEGSFISNPVEAQRLNSETYRQRLADAVVNAVRAYREGL